MRLLLSVLLRLMLQLLLSLLLLLKLLLLLTKPNLPLLHNVGLLLNGLQKIPGLDELGIVLPDSARFHLLILLLKSQPIQQ